MAWIEKGRNATFEHLPIPGMSFLDGQVFGQLLELKHGKDKVPFYNLDSLKGMKLALVAFPSGEAFPISEAGDPTLGATVHLTGQMGLPLFNSWNEAWERAHDIAQETGYLVFKRERCGLQIVGHQEDEHFLVSYDDEARRMENVRRLPLQGHVAAPPHLWIAETTREPLPKLYASEKLGLSALAQVKFFFGRYGLDMVRK